jgi:hypothetical protein
MKHPLPEHLQSIVEALCETGCQRVSDVIEILDKGADVKKTAALTEQERKQVLAELKNIMSVYDEDNKEE